MSEPKQPLCLTGKAVKFIDNKHRIYIPAYLVNQLTDKTFHMTRGQDKNLYAYPTEIFLEKAARLNKYYGSAGQRDREKRLYFMETMADAQPVQCDQQGRISIPQEFLDFAQIQDRVLIIGGFDKLLFWNPDLFEAFKKSGQMKEQERVYEFGWADKEQDETTPKNLS